MKVDWILREARLTLPILARMARVPLGYLKQLSAGNAAAGPETKEKLAVALDRHGAALQEYARQLREPPLDPD